MLKQLLTAACMALSLMAAAQKNKHTALAQPAATTIALQAENWDFKPQTVEFVTYKNAPAMKILPGSEKVVLKNMDFVNGTIQFDYAPIDARFATFYFHFRDAGENECFYFRTQRAGTSAIDAVQYAPQIGGVNIWDLLYHYQANANFKNAEWNHIKFVISGKQMRVYINNDSLPTLAVPQLEGNVTQGTLAFEGESAISNLVVKPNRAEGLDSTAGIDPTANDPQYIRQWQVSTPIVTTPKIELNYDWIPNKETKWEPITAERRGLVNLTRKFGGSEGHRLVWLKTTIHADAAQKRKMQLGFSDEVWVLINGQLLYIDKNWYFHPIRKEPDGRCTIENSSFMVPLKAGDNELMIGVGNDFYGWGIVARLLQGE